MTRVLVVDDDADIRDLVDFALTLAGLEVDTAHDGLVALERLEQAPYDVVLLDVSMPRVSGIEVAAQISSWQGERPGVIMMSALGSALDQARARDAGADAYLVKPVPLKELTRTVVGHARPRAG